MVKYKEKDKNRLKDFEKLRDEENEIFK